MTGYKSGSLGVWATHYSCILRLGNETSYTYAGYPMCKKTLTPRESYNLNATHFYKKILFYPLLKIKLFVFLLNHTSNFQLGTFLLSQSCSSSPPAQSGIPSHRRAPAIQVSSLVHRNIPSKQFPTHEKR